MQAPTLDIDKVFRSTGGPAGLHAKLRIPGLAPTTVRVWKTRGAIPGWALLPVLLVLRDLDLDVWSFVKAAEPTDVEEFDPFEGLH